MRRETSVVKNIVEDRYIWEDSVQFASHKTETIVIGVDNGLGRPHDIGSAKEVEAENEDIEEVEVGNEDIGDVREVLLVANFKTEFIQIIIEVFIPLFQRNQTPSIFVKIIRIFK